MTVAAIPTPTPYSIAWQPANQNATVGKGSLAVITPTTALPYVDVKNNAAFAITLSATITGLEFVNPQPGQQIEVYITQGASSYTITWAGIVWPAGTAPTLSTTSGSVDLIHLLYNEVLGYWFGTFSQLFS
jgi:hypothetical protein